MRLFFGEFVDPPPRPPQWFPFHDRVYRSAMPKDWEDRFVACIERTRVRRLWIDRAVFVQIVGGEGNYQYLKHTGHTVTYYGVELYER